MYVHFFKKKDLEKLSFSFALYFLEFSTVSGLHSMRSQTYWIFSTSKIKQYMHKQIRHGFVTLEPWGRLDFPLLGVGAHLVRMCQALFHFVMQYMHYHFNEILCGRNYQWGDKKPMKFSPVTNNRHILSPDELVHILRWQAEKKNHDFPLEGQGSGTNADHSLI